MMMPATMAGKKDHVDLSDAEAVKVIVIII